MENLFLKVSLGQSKIGIYYVIFLMRIFFKKIKKRNTFIVYSNNIDHLRNYVNENYGIADFEDYLQLLNNPDSNRSQAAQVSSNSKVKKTNVYSGFFIRTYETIESTLNGKKLNLKTLKGSSLFISDYKSFNIPSNITVVGVENYETFFLIERYKHHFEPYYPLFVLRHNTKSFIEWLRSIPNKYLHFGDFDLSGIAIYILEYRNKIDANRCAYFIPKNIDSLIGDSKNYKDYEKQLDDPKIKTLNFENYSEIKDLAAFINKYRKTVEQEVLMQ